MTGGRRSKRRARQSWCDFSEHAAEEEAKRPNPPYSSGMLSQSHAGSNGVPEASLAVEPGLSTVPAAHARKLATMAVRSSFSAGASSGNGKTRILANLAQECAARERRVVFGIGEMDGHGSLLGVVRSSTLARTPRMLIDVTRFRVRASRTMSPLRVRRRAHRWHPLADFNASRRIDRNVLRRTARAMSGRSTRFAPVAHPWPELHSRSASRSIERAAQSAECARPARDARQEAAEGSSEGVCDARAAPAGFSGSGASRDRAQDVGRAERAFAASGQAGRPTRDAKATGKFGAASTSDTATLDAAAIDVATVVVAAAVAAAHRADGRPDPRPSSRESGRSRACRSG